MLDTVDHTADQVLASARRHIGQESASELACDAVERGAVRRHAQAIMDENPIYSDSQVGRERFGGPVAPPLYPTHLFRRAFGTPDPIQDRANDPHFDGISATSTQGLPEIAILKDYAVLNGGTEIECLRYARHGDTVEVKSRYADIYSKQTSKGPMYFVILESEYRTQDGDLLIRVRRTQIRRKAA